LVHIIYLGLYIVGQQPLKSSLGAGFPLVPESYLYFLLTSESSHLQFSIFAFYYHRLHRGKTGPTHRHQGTRGCDQTLQTKMANTKILYQRLKSLLRQIPPLLLSWVQEFLRQKETAFMYKGRSDES